MKNTIDVKNLTRADFPVKSKFCKDLTIPYVVSKVPTPGMPEILCPVQADVPVVCGNSVSAFHVSRLEDKNGKTVRGVYVLTALSYDARKQRYFEVVTVYADKRTAERLYRFTRSNWDWDYAEGTTSVRGKEAVYKGTAEKVLSEIFE